MMTFLKKVPIQGFGKVFNNYFLAKSIFLQFGKRMKGFVLILVICIGFVISSFAQNQDLNQVELLSKYIGEWYGITEDNDLDIAKDPKIKMMVSPKLKGETLAVEVYEKRHGNWESILIELISYDKHSKQIVAYGQNELGECFVGKGAFLRENYWVMEDVNFSYEPTLKVEFDFVNPDTVHLKGFNYKSGKTWKLSYIKAK